MERLIAFCRHNNPNAALIGLLLFPFREKLFPLRVLVSRMLPDVMPAFKISIPRELCGQIRKFLFGRFVR